MQFDEISRGIFMRIRIFAIVVVLLLSACEQAPEMHRFSGKTMGTSYNIVAIPNGDIAKEDLQKAITKSLKRINEHLSNWDKTSEISRFNHSKTYSRLSM